MPCFSGGSPKISKSTNWPNSYASAVERNSFKEDLREILHNRNYRILFTSMTFVFGAVSLMFVFLPWTTKTYHY